VKLKTEVNWILEQLEGL